MNKKMMFLSAAFGVMSSVAMAQSIELPEPQIDNGVTLYQALKDRHSVRRFSTRPIDNQLLSNILWVAYGVNREDGRRTIPTARNEKDLSVYVTNNLGTFLYDADANSLVRVLDKSILDMFQSQPFMANVPLVLIYAGSTADNNYAIMHAGSAYQNVELYAATNDLGSVVRALFDKEAVAQALNLPDNQRVIVSQAIGYEEE
ncbi:MAG: nitroreductase family protein [Alphaproteobacteria bacterium]|nr:nitroreductase family protein [Alphaproteobacteria bacterium]